MTATLPPAGPAAAAPRTARLTRLTLSGSHRRADLVLPSDEPVGLLVPDLVAMVGGGVAPGADPRGYQLTTVDGVALDLAASLRDAGVPDGALIRLDPVTESPPAPILHDVADHVSDDLDRKSGRWGPVALRWTATGVAVLSALVAAMLTAPATGPVALLVAAAALAAAGVLLALTGRRPAGIAVLLAGAAAAAVAVPLTTDVDRLRYTGWALVVAVVVGLVGVMTGQRRAGFVGAGALLAQLGLWYLFGTAGTAVEQTAAVLAIVAIGGLGVLPRLAVMASGLAGLDDRQAADEPVTRVAATAAVHAAHRGLAMACLATAASAAVAGWLLAAAGSGWTLTLAGLTALAVLIRLRAFPLTVEVVALVAASTVIALGLLLHWMATAADQWWAGALAAGAVAVGAVVLLDLRPRPHVRARARQFADRVEGLVVVATVPVAVGVFGVYERLLNTF
ncbi:type VII secretion integral membrane protein EccD [Pseudonocardia humida]|uniref:Type VII secretion integral membrane protein EccD n=1 Tax=Pseudonocardia humida TaxID=2800819 RepID=A0ABT1A5W0_9PSEU|nr:type VII secretion integral membrane protein EccD [Pseudonocardia humida]MCO1658387.1 type VII secretion integral membrane protein EccD [Pseudonocardia humida]